MLPGPGGHVLGARECGESLPRSEWTKDDRHVSEKWALRLYTDDDEEARN